MSKYNYVLIFKTNIMKGLIIVAILFLNSNLLAQTKDYIRENYLLYNRGDGTYGIQDQRTKKWVKEGLTGFVSPYENYFNSLGLCEVKVNNKVAFLNEMGKIVRQTNYDQISYFTEEGFAFVNLNGKYGFINDKFQEIVKPSYDRVTDYVDGFAAVAICEVDNSGMYLDYKTGKPIPKNSENVFKAKMKWGLIDNSGKLITNLIYQNIGTNGSSGENEGWVVFFKDGLCSAKLNGKYGFIDKTGKEKIPFIYDYAYNFHEGYALVTKNGKNGFISPDNKILIPLIYDEITYYISYYPASKDFPYFENGKVKVLLNGNEYYINKKGEKITTPKNKE
jgi:hypothetical protein